MGNMGTDTYDSANKAKDYGTNYQKPIGSETYDSNTRAGNLGSGVNTGAYGSATQDYGSNPMNTGIGESQMSNKMDSEFCKASQPHLPASPLATSILTAHFK